MTSKPVCNLHKVPLIFDSQSAYEKHMKDSKDFRHRSKRNIDWQKKQESQKPLLEKTAWEEYYGN